MNFKKFFLTLLIFSLIFGFVNAISVSVNPSDNNEKSFTATITFGLGDGNTYCYSVQSGNSAPDCTDYSNTINGTSTTISLDSDVNTEGTYIITTREKDTNSGEESPSSTATFNYDTTAPTNPSITINDNSGYTNDNTPSLTLSASDALSGVDKMAFSCDDKNWTNYVNYSEKYEAFNMNDTNYGCSSGEGKKTIYVKFKDKAGSESNSASDTTIYDITKPKKPTGLKVKSTDDEKVTLTWEESESNDVKSVKVEYGVEKKYDKTKTLNYDEEELITTITGLDNGKKYYFRIIFVDKAGNQSETSSIVEATPEAVEITLSIKKDNKTIEYAKKGDKISIDCGFSKSVVDTRIYTKYDSKTTQTIKSNNKSATSISETIKIEEGYEEIKIWCGAGETDSTKKIITLDNEAPTIEWMDTNNICVLVKRLIVKANDDESLQKVDFVINNTTHNTKKTNNEYYLDFNTQTLENGNYTIKAIAYDEAGNTKEITRTITINNELTKTQICQKQINETNAKKKIIEDLIKYLQEQGVKISQEILETKKTADTDLGEAENKITKNVEEATNKVENAKTLYEQINTKLFNETKEAKNYVTKEGTIKETLKGLGFSEEISNNGENASKNNERKLKILKVGEEYHAVIELIIKNDTNSNKIKVLEIIPKELIEKATNIFSIENFTIIQEDPIIEFNLNIAPGETKTISYGTGKISKEKSEELITKNTINTYSTNPINLDENIETKKIIESTNITGIIFIGGVAILILLIIAGIIIGGTILLKQNHGFGGENTPTEQKQKELELKKENSWPKNNP